MATPSQKPVKRSHTTQIITGLFGWFDSQNLCEFRVVQGLQHALQLGAVIGLLFVFADWSLLSDRDEDFKYCLILRVLMVLGCAWFVRMTHKFFDDEANRHRADPPLVRFHAVTGLLIVHFVGNCTSLIAIIIGGSESNYFAGLIMVFVGIAILVPITPTLFALNVFAMVVFYVCCLIWDEHSFNLSVPALSNLMMVVSGAAISWFGCATIGRIRNGSHALIPSTSDPAVDFVPTAHEAGASAAATEVEQESPAEVQRARGQELKNLGAVATFIFGPIVGLLSQSQEAWVLSDRHLSISSVEVIGSGSYDQSVEFRNTSRLPIEVDQCQVLVHYEGRDYVFTIAVLKPGMIIRPGEKWRVYTNNKKEEFLASCTLDTRGSELPWAEINPKSIRLFGFKVVIP